MMFRRGSNEQRRNSREQTHPQQQQQFSAKSLIEAAWSRKTRSIGGSAAAASGNGESTVLDPADTSNGSQYTTTTTIVNRSTPVIFSTNRGIHLRVAKAFSFGTVAESSTTEPTNATSASASVISRTGTGAIANRTHNASNTANYYDIHFCDLERWSTNRANTVSLEDTFTVLQPARNSITSQYSQSIDSRTGASGVAATGYVPIKRCRNFSRFDAP